MKRIFILVAAMVASSAYADTQTIQTQGPATVTVTQSNGAAKVVHHHHKKVAPAPAPVAAVAPQYLPQQRPQIVYVPVAAPAKVEAPAGPRNWSVGAAVGELSQNGGVGIEGGQTQGLIGTYQLSPHWALRGDLDFSNFQMSDPSSVTTTTSSQVPNGHITCHNGPHHTLVCTEGSTTVSSSSTALGNANSDFNQTDVSISPTYRLLTTALSPVFGLGVDYSHSYYNTTYSGSAAGSAGGNTDSFNAVGLVGLDYRISEAVSVGVDFRYFQPVGYSTDNPAYYPAGNQSVSSVPYSTGTANLQIHF